MNAGKEGMNIGGADRAQTYGRAACGRSPRASRRVGREEALDGESDGSVSFPGLEDYTFAVKFSAFKHFYTRLGIIFVFVVRCVSERWSAAESNRRPLWKWPRTATCGARGSNPAYEAGAGGINIFEKCLGTRFPIPVKK